MTNQANTTVAPIIDYDDPNDEYMTPDVRIVFGHAFREIVIESTCCETMSVSALGARELAVRLNAIADLLDRVVEIAEDAS